MVALRHFVNVQIFQWWLEAITVPFFFVCFYLPQGASLDWLTNTCFNISQLESGKLRLIVYFNALSQCSLYSILYCHFISSIITTREDRLQRRTDMLCQPF